MTNEIAKILAASLEPLVNQEIITTLCGLSKVATQKKTEATVRFPVPYDDNSPIFQMDRSQLVPDSRQTAIVYFEGNDTDITSFEAKKSKGRTSLKLVCWYNSQKLENPRGGSGHVILISKILALISKAKPRPDDVVQGFDIDVTRLYDSAASLFSRYSYKEEYGQYLQNPYFALGIDITVTYQINHGCTTELLAANLTDCC